MGRARGYIRDPLPYPLLLGLCCLSFLTTRASGVCPEFRKYQDEHVAGGRHLAEIPGLSRCQAECLDTQACSGVDYGLNGCWIHTSQVADEDIQPLDGNTFYRLLPCQSGCTLRHPTRDDVTAPVDVVIRRPGVTRTECQVECRVEDRCVSFLHNDRENTCYLATNPVTMTTGVRANTTHYGKQLDCNGPASTGCTYIYYGEYGTEEYMEITAPTVTEISQCCEMCCRQDACVGVTFHLPSASQCHLLIDMSGNRRAAETFAQDLQQSLDGTVTYMRARDTTDGCSPNPCLNGAPCIGGDNGYLCACPDGFNGLNCGSNINECSSGPCENGGTCDDGVNGYTCRCVDGFNGVNCQVNINECSSAPCQNGGTCEDDINSFTCLCPEGFAGSTCLANIDECSPASCENDGICVDGVSSFTCQCRDGFTGASCQTNINECSSGPCENGGTCGDGVNGYTCRCVDGFNGVNCQININECSSGPCQNGGTCDDGVNGYTCRCVDGFNGLNCQININECSSGPCQNGGTCDDGVNGYTCRCVDGFNGVNCQININECSSGPCQNGGTCDDGVNGFTCRCVDGFNGENCQVNINECASSPCQNGGTCVDATNSYSCNCLDGFSGTNCEITQVSCVPNPCQNQGTCTPSGGASQCQCLEGYSGSLCESIINPWHGGECGRSKYADAGSPFSGAGVFIVGGQEARPNEFPWQVHIVIHMSSGYFACGGTILNSRWILTAAHCVSPYSELISTEVTAGQHVRSVREDFEQIFVVPASATYVHEDYDSDAITNDVALLKLPTAIEFNDNVLPACSPTESNLYENTRAVVSGWGLTTDGGMLSDTLLYIPALILPNTDCAARTGGAVPDGQLCIVDGVSEQRGTCQGDSGGPIVYQDPTGRFHVLGATSYGQSQCADELPDFFVRVTFYFSWISSKVYQDIPPSPWYANCLPFPCVNGGSCVDTGDTYRCDCVLGFTGTDCQINIDECASNPCQNGANCVDRVNGYSCTCPNGFTGNECEINTGDILHAWYDGTCGAPANPVLAVHPLIAGGVMAEIGQLPWQVRVLLYRPDTRSVVLVCTGAILNKRWVITSRYCLELLRSNVNNFPGHQPTVMTQDEVPVEFAMTEDHPGYSLVTVGAVRTPVNDVALLRLSTDMNFTQDTQPVCPPDLDRSYVGETAVLAGWGKQQDDGGSHRQLRPLYVSMEITDPSVCETAYADAAITQFPFDQRTLCDDGDATKGFCTYDWGAPLVVKDAANRWRLVGTASWRDGCNSENPGVYSRIRHFLFWITQQIHRDSQT